MFLKTIGKLLFIAIIAIYSLVLINIDNKNSEIINLLQTVVYLHLFQ